MKNILFLLLAAGFTNLSRSQSIDTMQKVDTVQTVDYGKMPPVYFSNKVYWERNYDKDNHLLFEALKYNSCFIGAFVNYWSNGRTKTLGQYLQNNTGDWTNLQSRGLCSVKDGEWKAYNEAGELINTITYDKGKIIKEQH
jgi:antitoxin component YwqK of YwqJK toxin-antitoxin module